MTESESLLFLCFVFNLCTHIMCVTLTAPLFIRILIIATHHKSHQHTSKHSYKININSNQYVQNLLKAKRRPSGANIENAVAPTTIPLEAPSAIGTNSTI